MMYQIFLIMKLNNKRKRMSQEKPLLSDFLEELKAYNKGSLLHKTISIYCNDWSLNPHFNGDYSERILIITAKLKDINPKEYQSYRALWYEQSAYAPNFIQILVKEIEK